MTDVTQAEIACEFEQHRTHLIGVAYRMLSSIADAEDAVQDAWLRLQRVDRSEIEDLRGWLTTVTGRLCLDRLRVPFDGVAGVLGVSTDAARQHASRARRAVHERAPRRSAPPDEHRAVLAAFFAAVRHGELQGLVKLLDPDVVLTSDGGGLVQAARRPIEGADRVGRFLLGIVEKARPADWAAELAIVNGEPGMIGWILPPDGGEQILVGVVTVDVGKGGLVERVALVVNPEKLIPTSPSDIAGARTLVARPQYRS
jgi:hypothetical protein